MPMSRKAKSILEWCGGIAAVIGAVVAVITLTTQHRGDKTKAEIDADVLLNQAWDYLGGTTGSSDIQQYTKDKQRLELARRNIEAAKRLTPRNGKAYWIDASLACAEERYDDAVRLSETAIRLEPTSNAPYNRIAWVYAYRNDWLNAEKTYRRALKITPNAAILHSNLCYSLFMQKQFDEAAVECNTAIRLEPHFEESYRNLADVRRAQGRSADADAVLRRLNAITGAGAR
jgi:tetratricopeptide (TPR) repeat protein